MRLVLNLNSEENGIIVNIKLVSHEIAEKLKICSMGKEMTGTLCEIASQHHFFQRMVACEMQEAVKVQA